MPTNSSGGRRPVGKSTSGKRTTAPRSGARSTGKRRKRKNKAQGYLYIAAALCILGIFLFALLISQISGCSDDSSSDTDESTRAESSEESTQSKEESNHSSTEESSEDTPESSDVTSDDVPTDNPIANRISAYEEYIGVEYSINMLEYEQYVCPENADRFVYIVNPNHTLAADYVPEDLVWCTNIRKGRPKDYSYINSTANKALEAFLKEAAHYGYDDITVTNAYRSYKVQSGLFNNYLANDLKEDYVCDTCHTYIDISYFPKNVKTIVNIGDTFYYCNGCGYQLTPDAEGKLYCEICMMEVTSPEIRQDKTEKVCCFFCKDCGNGKNITFSEEDGYYCEKCKKAVAPCLGEVRRPTNDEATAHVLTYSTKPGTSEHQTGLCCDMHNLSQTTSAFDNTAEAKWLAANAHRFGFILRYPEGKQHITGIKHESWHFRFVGRDAATEMFEKGLTLEEYLGEA